MVKLLAVNICVYMLRSWNFSLFIVFSLFIMFFFVFKIKVFTMILN